MEWIFLLIGLAIGWNVPMPPWAKYIWILILEKLGKTDASNIK